MSADSPDIMDPRIARARAMRQAGAETAEIARACGVGVSTIYRWAEAHGFRVADLEAAAWAASGRGDAPVSPSAEVSDARSASREDREPTCSVLTSPPSALGPITESRPEFRPGFR
jgi:transposase-like protein